MKIGILSDTHNRTENLATAVEKLRAQAITTVIHCGDVTSPEMIRQLEGFKVHLVFGNGDMYPQELVKQLDNLNTGSHAAATLDLVIDGRMIFVIHGDDRTSLDKAIESGTYDYVFTGHTHRFRNEQIGNTAVINPGALGGSLVTERSFCILDVETGALERVSI